MHCCARADGACLLLLTLVAGVIDAVSKAGMNSITKSMAKTYFAPHGIRTNVVAPGWVKTKMVEEYAHHLSASLPLCLSASLPLCLYVSLPAQDTTATPR